MTTIPRVFTPAFANLEAILQHIEQRDQGFAAKLESFAGRGGLVDVADGVKTFASGNFIAISANYLQNAAMLEQIPLNPGRSRRGRRSLRIRLA